MERRRISVTLTGPYIDALESLVNSGFYLTRGDVILHALRDLFKTYGISPFYLEAED